MPADCTVRNGKENPLSRRKWYEMESTQRKEEHHGYINKICPNWKQLFFKTYFLTKVINNVRFIISIEVKYMVITAQKC